MDKSFTFKLNQLQSKLGELNQFQGEASSAAFAFRNFNRTRATLFEN